MYCVKCGVELGDSERKCPLCSTPVYFPGLTDDRDTPYPPFVNERERINSRGIYFITTFAFLIAAIISLVCDMSVNGIFEWSGYVIGGLILTYVVLVLPGWFFRPHPAVFIPCDFAAVALYLAFINYFNGGEWFFTFALPVVAGVAFIVCPAVILAHYLKCGYLYICGGAFIAAGLLFPVVEWLTNVNFALHDYLVWSLYPAITFVLIGIMLIIIAIVKPLRESLRRTFNI